MSAGGSGSSGAAGVGTTPMGGECAPSAYVERPFELTGGILTSCGLDTNDQHALPNPSNLYVDSLDLPAPTIAGETYALTLDAMAQGPLDTELWAADDTCGTATELLWYAPLVNGTYCAELTPSAAYSHLLLVTRPLASGTNVAGYQGISLCPGGTCPNTPDGTGKQPGVTLTAPVGAYEAVGSGVTGTYRAYDTRLLPGGRMMLFDAHAPSKNETAPVPAGIFRMPSADRFGDAWYCVGADSTLTGVGNASDPIQFTFSFKNITRLGTCAGKQGAETSTFTLNLASGAVDAESSVPVLSAPGVMGSGTCRGTDCSFGFYDLPRVAWLELALAGDAGTYFEPTGMTVGVSEAAWIVQESAGSPVGLACASSGSLLFDPAATTTLSLEQMTTLASCPGEPVADDTLEGAIRGH